MRQPNDMFQLVLDSIPVRVFWKDGDSVFVGCNRVFAQDVGLSTPQEVIGKTDFDFGFPVEQATFLRDSDRAVMESDKASYHVLESQLKPDGTLMWLDITKVPLHDAEGAVIGMLGTYEDVTERRRIQTWLRDSEQRYRDLVEGIPDVIFILDGEGRFTYVNTHVEDFLEYAVLDILETHLMDYVIGEDKTKVEDLLCMGEDSVWDEEIGLRSASGATKYARLRCKRTHSGDGALQFEGMMRDVTRKKKLEEDLRTSRAELLERVKIIDELYEHIIETGKVKAISEHTAEVAHVLRQPLAIIGGLVRRMGHKTASCSKPEDEDTQRSLQIIVGEVERLETILAGLIDYTKRRKPGLEPVNPNEVIERVIRVEESAITEKDLSVELALGHEIGEMLLDPVGFEQVIRDLVANALEASTPRGVIRISTGVSIPSDKAVRTGSLDSGAFFEMKILNQGRTLTSDEIESIFNPFYTTKRYATGLGLPLARKIIEDHKGSISVKSDDNGTAFTLWLPMNPAAKKLSAAPLRVLVIDDMQPLLFILKQALAEYGLMVTTALTGEEGLEIYGNTSIDAIVCDIGMPGMTGWDVAEAVKDVCEKKGVPKTPVVLITGWGGQLGQTDRMRDTGVDGMLAKPVDIAKLAQVIFEVIPKKGQLPQL